MTKCLDCHEVCPFAGRLIVDPAEKIEALRICKRKSVNVRLQSFGAISSIYTSHTFSRPKYKPYNPDRIRRW